MATTLVFRLKYVPDDEADDIRQLLKDHDIAFYETSAGRWQISLAGIWVKDKDQAQQALQLIKEDQERRASNLPPPRFWDWIIGYLHHARYNPGEFLFTVLAILIVLGLSVLPFLTFL